MNNSVLDYTLALTSALITFGLVAVPGVASAADDVTQINEDTGANSRNRNRSRVRREHRDTRNNTSSAPTNVDVITDTGGNEQNENTDSGDQVSGDVEFLGDVVNELNQDLPDAAVPPDEDFDIDQTNKTTGARSRNSNRSRIRVESRIRVDNDARADTDVTVRSDTGDNEQNKNTTSGDQTSGDVFVDLIVTNTLN